MTQVISALQQKGGAGKTTLLSAIAGRLAREGAKVLLIDTDKQENLITWGERPATHKNIDTLPHTAEDTIYDTIQGYVSSGTYDTILIDTAGFENRMSVYAALASDLILIPCSGSDFDLAGATKTYKFARTLTRNDPTEIRMVLWKVNKQATVFKHVRAAFIEAELPIVGHSVAHSTGFEKMAYTGGEPEGAALREVGQLTAALQRDRLIHYFHKDEKSKDAA